ncbi:MAG: protoheme IX farnesyltransferase [Rhizobiaceae bacterium]|nr:protoheme IX farnesyltransferase [Rhizobiaceae bacterium]
MATLENEVLADQGVRISNATPADYFALLKPRVMSLVVFTALVGLVVAPGDINPFIAFIAILCITVGAGASGALNMWYEADIDKIMTRTANRPIPAGRITKNEALGFGLTLSFMSVLVMGILVNWFSASFLAFTIFYYAVFYTMWLKRATPQNIVIGGAAGAFPPMIGWAAVTGSASIESFALFAIIFLWTPPHFWALALFKKSDYSSAGIPMMPNVKGERSTQNQIFGYAIITAVSGVMPWVIGFASVGYGVVSALLGAVFIKYSYDVWMMPSDSETNVPAKKMFGFSILYLFLVFSALLVEAIIARVMA